MDKKDYEEPICPMDNSMWVEKKTVSIPIERVLAKEDEYFAQNDYASAERHLLYWWNEAENGNDKRGLLVLCNELMGLNRKLRNEKKAKYYAGKAIEVVKELGFQDTVSGATSYLNAGTVYKAFGYLKESLDYFEKAKTVYERELKPDDGRIAGLYNNMALTLADLGRFRDAKEAYSRAIDIVIKLNKASAAISWLNIADCLVREKGIEASEQEIQHCLETADELLDSVPESEWDGSYAYACEKCAPMFDIHGYFLLEKKYSDRAWDIYSSNRNK